MSLGIALDIVGGKSPLHRVLSISCAGIAIQREPKHFSASSVAGSFVLTAGSTVTNSRTNRQQRINQRIDDVIMLREAIDINL
jgi:hypothetical protein